MKKLRVLQIIDSLHIGGAEVLAVNIANELSQKNVDSFLCVTRAEGLLKEKISKEVNYIFLNRKSTLDISAIFKLKRYIKENKIVIIHAHSTSYFIACCVKLFLPKVKIIWHNHKGANIYLKGFRLKILKLSSFYINYIINVNKELNIWSKETLNKNSICINNFAKLQQNVDKITYLKGKNEKRIICVAGLRKEKDHITLLEAFKSILQRHPDWTLHLVGKNYKDTYGNLVVDFVTSNKLAKKVFFYGVKKDVKHILSQATIGVLSSNSEGLPVALLEYGLAKLPVLVTNVGQCKDVVQNTNGLVVPNNSKQFAEKLEVLINSQEIRNQLAVEINNQVLKNYSKERFFESLITIYNSI